jgi:hypothetical protein
VGWWGSVNEDLLELLEGLGYGDKGNGMVVSRHLERSFNVIVIIFFLVILGIKLCCDAEK